MSTATFAGLLLIVMPVSFNVAFGMLAARFDYPDILRPTEMVLSRFDVHLAGDHLVPKVRDYRRDEREMRSLAISTLRFSIPAICGFPRGRRRPLASRGCTVGVRFASNLGERDFPAPTLGRCMGVTTSIGLRHNHQR
jgi:hypothetical protein